MHASSTTRSRTAFVPWLAALVIGATAHAGWLVHELRTHETNDFAHTVSVIQVAPAEPHQQRHSPARSPRVHSCRHGTSRGVLVDSTDAWSELDFLITRTGRYEYAVDRELLARVDVAPLPGVSQAADASVRFARLLGVDRGAVELRNIRRATPLWHLGLRTGDRLLAIDRHAGVGSVEIAVSRRGRPFVLTYRVV